MSTIAVEKLGRFGARIEGADCDRFLDDDTFPAWCLETLEAHGVLAFPELHIDDATLVAFTHKLGTPVHFGVVDGFPEIWPVTLDRTKNPSPDSIPASVAWHIDGTVDAIPAKATLLTAKVLSESGDHTEFASTYAAYDDLTSEEQERFASLRVVHTLAGTQRVIHPNPTVEQLEAWSRVRPPREHPLVWQHRNGRRSLVIGSSAVAIVGMTDEEGDALLQALVARATTPDRVYRHEWSVGDLVIWDNRGVIHHAGAYDRSSPREMHRTTLEGDEPIQ